MNCEFFSLLKGSQCPHCGYTLKRDYDETPILKCELRNSRSKAAEICPHFLGAIKGDIGKLTDCGCDVQVCECELDAHPRCVVSSRGITLSDPTIMLCTQCPDNPLQKSTNGQRKTTT